MRKQHRDPTLWGPAGHEAETRRDLEAKLQAAEAKTRELESQLHEAAEAGMPPARSEPALSAESLQSTGDIPSKQAALVASQPPAVASKAVLGEGALAKWAKFANKK